MAKNFTIETLWKESGFKPNESQEKAIMHVTGPLYLTAGPGSGKTRVLLWRTLNLIVFHDIAPKDILLTTFTEKAAHQLKEGLQSLLGMAANHTGKQYDLASMFIGTVHSICNKLISDRRFYKDRMRNKPLKVIDQLEQYFFMKKRSVWERLLETAELDEMDINSYFQKKEPTYPNKHKAITDCIALFNRFSEERLDIESALNETDEDDLLYSLLIMYREYRECLKDNGTIECCDLSLIQEKALEVIESYKGSSKIFKHIIVDEYQDTNFIQEQFYFKLAGNKNICVVGDDDQALYRFRGSTVENFVEFPDRIKKLLGSKTTKIPLAINYRSKKKIVDFYTSFIAREDWTKSGDINNQYRVHDKGIVAHSKDKEASVVYIDDDSWIQSTVEHCRQLIRQGIVKDPNQIAFLFPSVKNAAARNLIDSLRTSGINVYAPRAGIFLEGQEATELFGVFSHIFDLPDSSRFNGRDFNQYKGWINGAHELAKTIINSDNDLRKYVADRNVEIQKVIKDYKALIKVSDKEKWNLFDEFDLDKMRRKLSNANGLSEGAKKAILSPYLARVVNERQNDDNQIPFKLSQIINRATSLNWSILDLFYQICGFGHFKNYFDQAENEGNEAPICNLSKITEYITKFMEIYSPILTANFLDEEGFSRLFFSSYLYSIYRMGESEYEDDDNPFPKGNVQFLTIHQSKGLEFPVVFVYPKRREFREADIKEVTVRELKNVEGEPLDKIGRFDIMRMFYVGLSRAENLLILPKLAPPKSNVESSIISYMNNTLDEVLATSFADYDISKLKIDAVKESVLSKPYSYTADFLAFERCPRQYMIFRKYGFVPSRSQTMFFGSLVHNTIEDLHQKLIAKRVEKV